MILIHHLGQYSKMPGVELVEGTFKYHILLMKIFGLYPYERCPWIFKPYAFLIYLVFTFTTPILADVHLALNEQHDIKVITENGFMIVELTALIVKYLPCILNHEGTRRTIYSLNKPVFNNQLPEQDYILLKTVSDCKFIFGVFSTSCLFALLTWASWPLMYENRTFPLAVWLPFEPFENTAVYLSVYFVEFMCVTAGAVDNVTLDTTLAFLILHAAGQIKILKDTLMHLNRRVDEEIAQQANTMTPEEKEELKSSIIYKRICECVNHYDAIFEFVEDLENTYDNLAFSQMVASISIICICCFQLSVVVPFSIPFFGTVTFTVAILMEQFLYCYSGTILYDESDSIINAIYMSEWYNYDEKSKKALLTMMERAKRPMKVTSGKLLDLSLGTFTMIIRRSYSLLAVLRNY